MMIGFDGFCSKVSLDYVPSYKEAFPQFPITNTQISLDEYMLTAPFTLSEFCAPIFSRKSLSSGMDNISPLLIQNLPSEIYLMLLDILNSIWLKRIPSWREFHIISISKNNSNSSFRFIAL